MSAKRQKSQYMLAFMEDGKGEAPKASFGGTEAYMTAKPTESPVIDHGILEEICNPTNLSKAWKRVKSNRGAPGIDGMTVDELREHLLRHGEEIREGLLAGEYRPSPVKRVEIPKPGGGVRKLGIPTVVDRFVQQAVLQVLQKIWDPTFSEHSFGFRPGRSAHQAVAQAQEYIEAGYGVVVDMDLEKFFDRVNHDLLMSKVATRVKDKRVLKLIRAFLNAGIMENGLVSPPTEGTPQGGPLSPLLSNIMLDEFDRELGRRGHRFVRYADDCNIYVRSLRAGRRVMENLTSFLERKLNLKVNQAKSAVARPRERKFLGFSFTGGGNPRRRISPQALSRMKIRVRELTRRTKGISLEKMVKHLGSYLRGWRGYFGFCQTPSVLRELDAWIRRRLRCVVWEQWQRGRKRYKELCDRGVNTDLAARTAGSSLGPWHLSRSKAIHYALPNKFFREMGLPLLEP